jgi:hypothetical protein
MPRAAPGNNARGVLRRDLPEDFRVTVRNFDSCLERCPYRLGMEMHLHRLGSRSQKCRSFTLQLSGFGFDRGGLGEVVSLVGDCRPPPPGNPRRPPNAARRAAGLDRRRERMSRADSGGFCFTAGNPISGDVLSSGWKYCSFNKFQNCANLKKLDIIQYFKNNRSYYSCVGIKHVLKFDHLSSHLCGQQGVRPPPIAITNVLETRKMICVVPIAEMKNQG